MGVLTNYNYNPNIGAVNGFGLQQSNTVFSAKVAATTDTTLAVPQGSGVGQIGNTTPKAYAVFGYGNGATVWVANNGTAVPNETGTFTASNSVINPTCMWVKAGDTLHFYSDAASLVSVAFYAWQ